MGTTAALYIIKGTAKELGRVLIKIIPKNLLWGETVQKCVKVFFGEA